MALMNHTQGAPQLWRIFQIVLSPNYRVISEIIEWGQWGVVPSVAPIQYNTIQCSQKHHRKKAWYSLYWYKTDHKAFFSYFKF